MTQDIELKFDDDKDESSQKLSVESNVDQNIPKSISSDIEHEKVSKEDLSRENPIEQKNIPISTDTIPSESSVEVSDETAYKTGVLAIGLPILLLLIIMGVATYKPSQVKKTDKLEIKNEEVIVETDEADHVSNNKQPDTSVTNEQGSGFADGELYIVKPGETLYEIGLELDMDWKLLAEINGIEPPYDLKSGQELELPK